MARLSNAVYPMGTTTTEAKLRAMENRIEGLEETLEVLADKKTLDSIRKSLEDVKSGRYRDYAGVKELRARLDSGA